MKSLFSRFHDISFSVIAHNNLLFHSASMILCLNRLLVSHDFSCAYAGDEITREQNNAILRWLANEIIIENSTNPSSAARFVLNSGVYYFTSIYVHHLVRKFMRMNFHKYNKFNWLHFSYFFLTHVVRRNNFAIKLILFNFFPNEQTLQRSNHLIRSGFTWAPRLCY